jgi:hypothetical protein
MTEDIDLSIENDVLTIRAISRKSRNSKRAIT